MYNKQTMQDKLAMQFMYKLKKRGLNVNTMSYYDLLYEWACYVNDIAVSHAHDEHYNRIENKVKFPKAMLLYKKEDNYGSVRS